MSRPKLLELDALRGCAIAAVLLIHGTAAGSSASAHEPDIVQQLMLFVNKLCAFAVPVFIFVSGLVLFYSAPASWNKESLGRFYVRRARTALVPYVLWSFIYYVVNQWLAHGGEMRFDPVYFCKVLLTGGASYHLYFLVIIIQFYAVFPLIATLVRRYDPEGKLLLGTGVLLQAGFYVFSRLVHPIPFSYLWAFGYAALFTLGGWFGLRYGARAAGAQRHGTLLLALGFLFGIGFSGLHLFALQGVAATDVWYELCYAGLGLAAATALIAWTRRLQGRVRLLDALGRASFGIYLVHPLMLSFWRLAVPIEPYGWGYAALNTVGVVFVLALSWGVVIGYERVRRIF